MREQILQSQHGQAVLALQQCLHRGMLARRSGDRLEALAHFTAAASFNPDDGRIQAEIARELIDLGRLREARERVESILAEMPGEARAGALLQSLHRAEQTIPG